jgi:hypothetical protein
MRFALHDLIAVFERGATVIRPGHVEDARGSPNALHP